jgi:hypothetical protein
MGRLQSTSVHLQSFSRWRWHTIDAVEPAMRRTAQHCSTRVQQRCVRKREEMIGPKRHHVRSLRKIQPEHIIGKHPCVVCTNQLEELTELQRIRLPLGQQLSGDEYKNTAAQRGLAVNSYDAKIDLPKGQSRQVLRHSLLTDISVPFPRQNRLILIQTTESGPVRLEGVIVVVCELLTNRLGLICGLHDVYCAPAPRKN